MDELQVLLVDSNRDELNLVESNAEIYQLKNECAKLKEKIGFLQANSSMEQKALARETEDMRSALSEALAKSQTIESELRGAKERLADVSEDKNDLQRQNVEVLATLETVQNKLCSAMNEIEAKCLALDEWRKYAEPLEVEAESRKLQIKHLENEILQSGLKSSDLEKQLEAMGSKLAAAENEKCGYLIETRRLQSVADQLNGKLAIEVAVQEFSTFRPFLIENFQIFKIDNIFF